MSRPSSNTAPPRPIVILGPTAGGKSELAVRLAEWLGDATGKGGEVISADSMQLYKHLDAGTAKPTPDQRRRAVHHLIDCIEPTQRFTVSDWLNRADALIAALQQRGVTPIIVGGTNLYIKALLEGMFDGPPADAALRKRLAQTPLAQLHARLETIDPDAAARIHPNDQKRIIRALEVFELTGLPISGWQTQWEDEATERQSDEATKGKTSSQADTAHGPMQTIDADLPALRRSVAASLRRSCRYRHHPILLGLHWPAEAINPRINLRVRAMFFPEKVAPDIAAAVTPRGESLPDETARLEAAGQLGPQARQALGYKQVLEHLAGQCTLDDAFERTKILTRRFAKQQRTWLKRFAGVTWLDAHAMTDAQQLDAAMAVINHPTGRPEGAS